MKKEEEFNIGDKVIFAKNVWRGRTVLFKGTVKRVTPKMLVVDNLEDKEGVTAQLYTYGRNGEIKCDKTKAVKYER